MQLIETERFDERVLGQGLGGEDGGRAGWSRLLWVANSQSCRKDARTNSLAVIRAVTANPESCLRIPR
jgi:hypothetical protein